MFHGKQAFLFALLLFFFNIFIFFFLQKHLSIYDSKYYILDIIITRYYNYVNNDVLVMKNMRSVYLLITIGITRHLLLVLYKNISHQCINLSVNERVPKAT